MEYLVNQQIKLGVTSTGLATALTALPVMFLVNGNPTTVTYDFSEIGSGLYTVNFIPAQVGKWSIFVGGLTYGFDVVSKTLQNSLQDVLDECLGSWSWNKVTGLLTLFRGDGSTLATYQVTDTSDEAVKERLT